MGNISFSAIQDGTTGQASQVNNPLTTIYDEFNGNITSVNLADSSVTTAKVADGAIEPVKLSSEARWWEELARTTLSAAGSAITVSGITAKSYLRVLISTEAAGGTTRHQITFNNDSGSNYAINRFTDGSQATDTSQAFLEVIGGVDQSEGFCAFEVSNIATKEKLATGQSGRNNAAGAANAPNRSRFFTGKWVNTSDQITRLDITNGTGTGDFAIGSEVIVLGHD